VKGGSLSDSVKPTVLAKFQHYMYCSFCGASVKNHQKNVLFWYATSPKIIKNLINDTSPRTVISPWSQYRQLNALITLDIMKILHILKLL
jgi:hypothetical protein